MKTKIDKINFSLNRKAASAASRQCDENFGILENELSGCFRMNPGLRLDEAMCKELLNILDKSDEREKALFGTKKSKH